MTLAKSSKWDSDVFGVRIGLLKAGPDISVEDVRLDNRGIFDVVFVKSEGWVDPEGFVAGLDHQYEMELKAQPEPRRDSIVSEPSPRHLEIARTAFHDSRFLRDRRLAEKTPELYSRWVAGKKVHVLKGAPDDAFLVASEDEDGARRVSLVAVDERRRGEGIGYDLLAAVVALEGPAAWRVRVSARNHGAIRFYENAGFRVRGVCTAFHVWTEGGMA